MLQHLTNVQMWGWNLIHKGFFLFFGRGRLWKTGHMSKLNFFTLCKNIQNRRHYSFLRTISIVWLWLLSTTHRFRIMTRSWVHNSLGLINLIGHMRLATHHFVPNYIVRQQMLTMKCEWNGSLHGDSCPLFLDKCLKKDVIRFPWDTEQEGEATDTDADLNWNTTFFANQKRCAMRTLNLCVSCWHE